MSMHISMLALARHAPYSVHSNPRNPPSSFHSTGRSNMALSNASEKNLPSCLTSAWRWYDKGSYGEFAKHVKWTCINLKSVFKCLLSRDGGAFIRSNGYS